MTIMLVNPPGAAGTTANREGSGGLGVATPGAGGFVYPPQTLAYVAASLREAGHAVMALDAVAEELTVEQALGRLFHAPTGVQPLGDGETRGQGDKETVTLSPPLLVSPAPPPLEAVGVLVSVATLQADLDFVDALARARPGVSVFVFGHGVRYVWRQVLENSAARLAVLGEAEFNAPAVVEALAADDPEALAGLPGVAYRLNGEIVHHAAGQQPGDLDALPYPAWDLLPHDGYPFLTLAASRGCDDGCAYCPYVAAQGRWRARSPAAVAAEARWLERTYGKPRLIFRDPVFAADRERTVALCEALRRARVRTPWECESRPEHFDADLLYRLRRAGCQTVKLGLETVDETLLWGMNRLRAGWTVARYRAHVAELVASGRRLGLNCRVFVMTGLPGETRTALEATLAFLQALRPPAVSVTRTRPYPGTRLGEKTGDAMGLPALPEAEL
ncbi:MAG: radical SAM protein, partial [Chloroflexi bacterium]|nr:radical SAM protein [Chloroflexota bacterium]